MLRGKQKKNEEGQAVIELALTILFSFSLALFVIQLAMAFAFGSFVQYGTFMSARAYLSGGRDPGDQVARAENVLSRVVKRGPANMGMDRFPFLAMGDGAVGGAGQIRGAEIGNGSNFDRNNPDLSWMQGVRYTFRTRLFWVPLNGSGTQNSGTNASYNWKLTSESWLGRDPTYVECRMYMSQGGGSGWIYDNGC